MRLLLTALPLTVLALASSTTTLPPVNELDASSFASLLNDAERDHLILVVLSSEGRPRADAILDGLSVKLRSHASITLSVWDSTQGGRGSLPPGVELHSHGDDDDTHVEVLLFPAGGREPTRYSFAHDPLSEPPPKGSDVDADTAEDAHFHALAPSISGVQRWLRGVTTFPSDVPTLTLAEIWAGRESELFSAVGGGLEALRQTLEATKAALAEARAENAVLAARCGGTGGGGGGGAGEL